MFYKIKMAFSLQKKKKKKLLKYEMKIVQNLTC
jgi:hypothetical protein